MQKIYVLAGAALIMAACGGSEKDYDATGTFEAIETTVFAEQSGALLSFDVNEGDMIEAARQVGLIDTTQTWLKIQQMDATKAVYQSQKPDMERQIAATRQQLAKAQQDEQRYRELVADGAAPHQHASPRQADGCCRCAEGTVAGYVTKVSHHDSHKGYCAREICGAW